MGRVDKNKVAIALNHIKHDRYFLKKDLDYLCRLIGLRAYTKTTTNSILFYFPHIAMCKAWNAGNATDSWMNKLCKPGEFVHFWWNTKKLVPNRNWVLCEYHPANENDVRFMLEILQRKGYEATEEFPPCGSEYIIQDRGTSLPFIFWAEPTTRDYLGDAGETEY